MIGKALRLVSASWARYGLSSCLVQSSLHEGLSAVPDLNLMYSPVQRTCKFALVLSIRYTSSMDILSIDWSFLSKKKTSVTGFAFLLPEVRPVWHSLLDL